MRVWLQTQAIITQLVFDHALRSRVKFEADEPAGETSGSINTPENDSTVRGDTESEETNTGDATQTTTGTSTEADSDSKGKSQLNKPVVEADNSDKKNMVGKINNLVTSDLGNLHAGLDYSALGMRTMALQNWHSQC